MYAGENEERLVKIGSTPDRTRRSVEKSTAAGELSQFGEFGVGNPLTLRRLLRMRFNVRMFSWVASLLMLAVCILELLIVSNIHIYNPGPDITNK